MPDFKHNINEIIEGCAEALKREMQFNPLQIIRNFHLFHMNFFENTPRVPDEEIENWYYLRDSGTHSAVIYNHETREVRLVEPAEYWDEEMIAEYRLTEEEIEEIENQYSNRIEATKRTLAYRKLRPVIEWYFKCPLPFVRLTVIDYSPFELIEKTLEDYADQFELESSDYKQIANNLFDAYHYDGGQSERDKNYIMVGVDYFKKDGVYYSPETFTTPEDVLEFYIKHNEKDIYTFYENRVTKYKIEIRNKS
jgi:hypothetical protein